MPLLKKIRKLLETLWLFITLYTALIILNTFLFLSLLKLTGKSFETVNFIISTLFTACLSFIDIYSFNRNINPKFYKLYLSFGLIISLLLIIIPYIGLYMFILSLTFTLLLAPSKYKKGYIVIALLLIIGSMAQK